MIPTDSLVVAAATLLVHRVEVEVHLADVLGLEFADLQVDHYEPPEGVVVEEQVEEELPLADLQRLLATVEREPLTEFEQEPLDVVDQRLLQLAFVRTLAQTEEVEDVRTLGGVERPLCVGGLEDRGEVGDRGAGALEQA